MNKYVALATVLIFLIAMVYIPNYKAQSSNVIVQAQSNILGSIPDFLSGAAAVALGNSIYLIGGDTLNGFSQNVYVYQDGSWHLGPVLPFQLTDAAAVVYNGTIYVVGGLTSVTQISGSVLALENNHWVVLSNSMPVPVYDALAIAYDNKIYVIGGFNGTLIYAAYGVSNLIQVFYLNNDSWSIVGKLPFPIASAGHVIVNNTLYMFGGYGGYYGDYNSLLAFYPQNLSIVNITAFKFRGIPGAFGYYNGAFISIGGQFWMYNVLNDTSYIFVYYNGTWRTLPTTEAYQTFDSAYVQLNNTIYIMGGRSVLQGNNQVNVFQDVVINITVIKPKVIKHYPPLPPYNVQAKAGNESVYLSWQDVNASGYYIIYWSSLDNTKNNISVGNVTSYNFTNLIDGITYFFQVQAYNQYGLSNLSQVVSAVPFSVPLQPTILNIIPGNENLTVIWSPPGFTGGFPILGYYIGYRLYNSSHITWINVGNVTEYTLTGLQPGVEYYVYIKAYNKWGNSTYSKSFGIPAEISNIKVFVQKEENGINVSWNSSFEANYTLLVINKTSNSIIFNKTFPSNVNAYFIPLPFGNYTIEILASNPAGVSVSKVYVIYYLPPKEPTVNIFMFNNTLVISWNKVPYAFYYVIQINGYEFVTSNDSLVYSIPDSGVLNIIVKSYNPAGFSSPYIVKLVVPKQSVTVQKFIVNVVRASTNITKLSISTIFVKEVKEHSNMYYIAVIGLLLFMIILSVVVLFSGNSGSSYDSF
ncbi:MAG: fibronectin type III domain-containing protein [Sulfolobaceae archaeon]|nr:fibronectin type III domain-containing protein [Sulfolobaceae archaeon]